MSENVKDFDSDLPNLDALLSSTQLMEERETRVELEIQAAQSKVEKLNMEVADQKLQYDFDKDVSNRNKLMKETCITLQKELSHKKLEWDIENNLADQKLQYDFDKDASNRNKLMKETCITLQKELSHKKLEWDIENNLEREKPIESEITAAHIIEKCERLRKELAKIALQSDELWAQYENSKGPIPYKALPVEVQKISKYENVGTLQSEDKISYLKEKKFDVAASIIESLKRSKRKSAPKVDEFVQCEIIQTQTECDKVTDCRGAQSQLPFSTTTDCLIKKHNVSTNYPDTKNAFDRLKELTEWEVEEPVASTAAREQIAMKSDCVAGDSPITQTRDIGTITFICNVPHQVDYQAKPLNIKRSDSRPQSLLTDNIKYKLPKTPTLMILKESDEDPFLKNRNELQKHFQNNMATEGKVGMSNTNVQDVIRALFRKLVCSNHMNFTDSDIDQFLKNWFELNDHLESESGNCKSNTNTQQEIRPRSLYKKLVDDDADDQIDEEINSPNEKTENTAGVNDKLNPNPMCLVNCTRNNLPNKNFFQTQKETELSSGLEIK